MKANEHGGENTKKMRKEWKGKCGELKSISLSIRRSFKMELKFLSQIINNINSSFLCEISVLYQDPRRFGFLASMASGNQDEERLEGGASNSSGDAGESRPSRGEHIQRDNRSRYESVEYLRTLRNELKRILPHVPDLTLPRWSKEKIREPILEFLPNVLSSSSDSIWESWSDSRLSPKLKSDSTASCLF